MVGRSKTGRASANAKSAGNVKALEALPAAPKQLSPAAAAKWRDAGGKLVDAQMLTALDLDALLTYCQLWAVVAVAQEDVKNRGIKEGFRKNQAIAIIDSLAKHVRAYQEQLGLTVLGRHRLGIDPSGGPSVDELGKFLGGGKT